MVDFDEDAAAEFDGLGGVVVGMDGGGASADVGVAFVDCDADVGAGVGVVV